MKSGTGGDNGKADPRIAELTELAVNEGITLPLPVSLILWFEDRGCVVDLLTGSVGRPADWGIDPIDTPRAFTYTQLTSSLT